jgi:guanosine-3',5'-bis(diphosphate) 3'-pyrophosphohydrolase
MAALRSRVPFYVEGAACGIIALPVSTDLSTVLRAAAFAADKHRNQRRKDSDATPYINHPLALANVLAQAGVYDPIVISAALLHDTVEDTKTSYDELASEFSPDVARVVLEVTDDKSLPKAERKRLQVEHAPHLSDRAKLVKLADKICNVRDMNDAPPADWPIERRQEYFAWAKRVVDGLRGVHPQLERQFDAEIERWSVAQGAVTVPNGPSAV